MKTSVKPKVKLWLDNKSPVATGWVSKWNLLSIIELLKTHDVIDISIDDRLCTNDGVGYDVLVWLDEQISLDNIKLPNISIHTINPPEIIMMNNSISSMIDYINQKNV